MIDVDVDLGSSFGVVVKEHRQGATQYLGNIETPDGNKPIVGRKNGDNFRVFIGTDAHFKTAIHTENRTLNDPPVFSVSDDGNLLHNGVNVGVSNERPGHFTINSDLIHIQKATYAEKLDVLLDIFRPS